MTFQDADAGLVTHFTLVVQCINRPPTYTARHDGTFFLSNEKTPSCLGFFWGWHPTPNIWGLFHKTVKQGSLFQTTRIPTDGPKLSTPGWRTWRIIASKKMVTFRSILVQHQGINGLLLLVGNGRGDIHRMDHGKKGGKKQKTTNS